MSDNWALALFLLGGVAGTLLAALIVMLAEHAHLLSPDNAVAGFLIGAASACLGMFTAGRLINRKDQRA